jgi:hypothetical protein
VTDMPCRVSLDLNAHLSAEEARSAAEDAFYDDLMELEIAEAMVDPEFVVEAISEADLCVLGTMLCQARGAEVAKRDASIVYREIGAWVMKTVVDYTTKVKDQDVRDRCVDMGATA